MKNSKLIGFGFMSMLYEQYPILLNACVKGHVIVLSYPQEKSTLLQKLLSSSMIYFSPHKIRSKNYLNVFITAGEVKPKRKGQREKF